jgi:hypothetical protein
LRRRRQRDPVRDFNYRLAVGAQVFMFGGFAGAEEFTGRTTMGDAVDLDRHAIGESSSIERPTDASSPSNPI